MKKLLSILAVCLLSLQAVFALGDAQFGIDLGAGIVTNFGSSQDVLSLKPGYNDLALKPNFGWRLGFEASWNLKSIGQGGPVEAGPRWVLQAGFSTRGYHWKNKSYKESLHTFDFQVAPFLFGWHFNFRGGEIGLRPHTGPYVSIDFAGLTKIKDDDEDLGIEDEKTSIWDKDVINDKGDKKRSHQFFDVGWQEGVDVYLLDQHLYLGIMVQEGFMQFVKKDFRGGYSAGTHFGFMARVGYRF